MARSVMTVLLVVLGSSSRVAAQDASPEPEPEPQISDGSGRLFTWIVGGLAVASVVTTVVFWAVANSEYDALETECARRPCTEADVAGVDTLVTLTNVGIGASLGLFALAIVLFFVEGPDPPDPPAVALDVGVGPGSGSVILRGRF